MSRPRHLTVRTVHPFMEEQASALRAARLTRVMAVGYVLVGLFFAWWTGWWWLEVLWLGLALWLWRISQHDYQLAHLWEVEGLRVRRFLQGGG